MPPLVDRIGPLREKLPPLRQTLVLGIAAVIYGVNLAGRRQGYQQEVAEHQSLVADAQRRVDRATAGLNDAARRVKQAEQAVARARSDVTSAQRWINQLLDEQQSLERAPAVSVVAHAWNVQLKIEECTAKKGEGWNHPSNAFDVRSEQHVHHHEKVLDHVETLYRTETYRAQDGYDTETYTERVSAGTRQVQDGYTVEDLGNGRFRRTPKYRTETVYKNVTKTRQKPRMVTKTRQVPYQKNVYRQDTVHKLSTCRTASCLRAEVAAADARKRASDRATYGPPVCRGRYCQTRTRVGRDHLGRERPRSADSVHGLVTPSLMRTAS